MPTTTPVPAKAPARRRSVARRAYTLVEILVASSLSSLILAAVLSSVLMMTRSGYLLNNYIEMETQARIALDTFSMDARMASDIDWSRATATAPLTGMVLTLPTGASVRYTYDADAGTLTRQTLAPSAGAAQVIISGIQSLTFIPYKINTEAINPAGRTLSSVDGETKQIQIALSARRTRATVSDATNTVVSARFVLRNKRVTA